MGYPSTVPETLNSSKNNGNTLDPKGRRAASTRPVSFRVTSQEYEILTHKAGRFGLGAYIRRELLGEGRQPAVPVPTISNILLARLLSDLGQSGMAANLRTLAEAARVGALHVTPETEAEISHTLKCIEALRAELLLALGLRREVYE